MAAIDPRERFSDAAAGYARELGGAGEDEREGQGRALHPRKALHAPPPAPGRRSAR
jgi:hypothetical protein